VAPRRRLSGLVALDALIGPVGVVDTIHRAETFPLKEVRGDMEANLAAQFTVAQAGFRALREGHRPPVRDLLRPGPRLGRLRFHPTRGH
jgi:hypothetical protein